MVNNHVLPLVVLLVTILGSSAVSIPDVCSTIRENDRSHYIGNTETHCLVYLSQPTSKTFASALCRNGQLLEIRNQDQQRQLQAALGNRVTSDVWLGLELSNDQWRWDSDHSPLKWNILSRSKRFIFPSAPKNCAVFFPQSGAWRPVKCDESHALLCQYEKLPKVSTTVSSMDTSDSFEQTTAQTSRQDVPLSTDGRSDISVHNSTPLPTPAEISPSSKSVSIYTANPASTLTTSFVTQFLSAPTPTKSVLNSFSSRSANKFSTPFFSSFSLSTQQASITSHSTQSTKKSITASRGTASSTLKLVLTSSSSSVSTSKPETTQTSSPTSTLTSSSSSVSTPKPETTQTSSPTSTLTSSSSSVSTPKPETTQTSSPKSTLTTSSSSVSTTKPETTQTASPTSTPLSPKLSPTFISLASKPIESVTSDSSRQHTVVYDTKSITNEAWMKRSTPIMMNSPSSTQRYKLETLSTPSLPASQSKQITTTGLKISNSIFQSLPPSSDLFPYNENILKYSHPPLHDDASTPIISDGTSPLYNVNSDMLTSDRQPVISTENVYVSADIAAMDDNLENSSISMLLKESNTAEPESNFNLIIALAVGWGGVLGISLAVIAVYVYRRRRNSPQEHKSISLTPVAMENKLYGVVQSGDYATVV